MVQNPLGQSPEYSVLENRGSTVMEGAQKDESYRPSLKQPNVADPQDICPSIVPLQPGDQAISVAENFGVMASIPKKPFRMISTFYQQQIKSDDAAFLDVQVFHSFVELYFEYFDVQFPFVHPSMLEAQNCSWLLLLAVAAAGSQYSESYGAMQNGRVLLELLHRGIKMSTPHFPDHGDLSLVQSICIRDIILLFAGSKKWYMSQQYERNILITLCRYLIKPEPESVDGNQQTGLDPRWESWLGREARIRQLYCVRLLEYLQLVFFDLPPSVDLASCMKNGPCDDILWRCKSAAEWRDCSTHLQERDPDADIEKPNAGLQPTTGLKRMVQLIELYAEERLMLEKLRLSSFHQRLFSTISPTFPRQEDSTGSLEYFNSNRILQAITSTADQRFQKSQDGPKFAATDDICKTHENLTPLLHILRKVQLRTLHSFAGWQASEVQIINAKNELRAWMLRHAPCARECLWHASLILAALRKKSHFACYDALLILTAVLYIWAYDTLVIGEVVAASRSLPSPSVVTTLRLDHPNSQAAAKSWINEGGVMRVHVTGIGILDGADSSVRLLKELQKILLSRASWQGLCRSLAKSVTQHLQGQRPVFEDD